MHEAVHDKLVEEHRTLEPQGGDLQAIAGKADAGNSQPSSSRGSARSAAALCECDRCTEHEYGQNRRIALIDLLLLTSCWSGWECRVYLAKASRKNCSRASCPGPDRRYHLFRRS